MKRTARKVGRPRKAVKMKLQNFALEPELIIQLHTKLGKRKMSEFARRKLWEGINEIQS